MEERRLSNGNSFDLVVIGSGPGGYVAAIRAGQLGLTTAIVERDAAGCGGTCLLRGCIPTKALLHTADVYEQLSKGRELGIVVEKLSLDFKAVMERKNRIVRRLSKGIESYLFKKNKVTLVKGTGRIEGPRSVVVSGEQGTARLAARHILIATGSRPRGLPGLAPDGKALLSSDDMLELAEVPARLVVIGAGAVGMEFASLFARLGSTVTVIELLPRILPLEDEEISLEAAKILGKQMTLHTSARTESVRAIAGGVEVVFKDAQGQQASVEADKVLVAVGRGPVTEGLGLDGTKIQLDKGYVPVNAQLETAEAGIFAIGDVIALPDRPHPQLAHVASHEGIHVAEHIAGRKPERINYDHVPGATYCSPEVASVGLTEAEARKRGYAVAVGRFPFGNLAKPRIIGHEHGLVKVVSESKYGELLGVHMVGPHATDLIAEACIALRLESTVEEIFRTIHPHPTLSEALMQAAEAVYGIAIDA
jgi:dihydrolipoamide dehydrogenase